MCGQYPPPTRIPGLIYTHAIMSTFSEHYVGATKKDGTGARVAHGYESCPVEHCENPKKFMAVKHGFYYGTIKDDGIPDGEGGTYYRDGSYYKAMYKKGKETFGKKVYPNGDRFQGCVDKNCKPHGFGTMMYANGSKYSGGWEHGQRQGKCAIKFPDGTVCTGTYVQDELFSSFITYPNGDKFVGNLDEIFKPHGYGTMMYANGPYSSYEGTFQNGKRHGEGCAIDMDKEKMFVGVWVEDTLTIASKRPCQ